MSCIVCCGPFDGTGAPRLPDCGHLHCGKCFAETVFEGLFHCKWHGCGKTQPAEDVRRQPTYETLVKDGPSSPQEEVETVAALGPELPRGQALDPELDRLARYMGHSRTRNMNRQVKKRRTSATTTTEAEETYYTEDLKKRKVLSVLIKLSKVVKNCKDIQGFSETIDGDKIILDIALGKRASVTSFLDTNFKQEVSDQCFDFTEHDAPPELLMAPGSKVTSRSLLANNGENQHPDNISCSEKLATVACLAIDVSGQKYILTANHIFGSNNVPKEDGRFISCYRNKMRHVSDEYAGALGTVTVPVPAFYDADEAVECLVDIAALKLTPAIQQDIDKPAAATLLCDLKPIYRTPFEYSNRDLTPDTVVFKRGAVSGLTHGKVVNSRYFYCSGGQYGFCFVIQSLDEHQRFAEPGDSGALIWNQDLVPIGIVFSGRQPYMHKGTRIQATYGVRLDHCIEKLREKDVNIDYSRPSCLQFFDVPIPAEQRPPAPALFAEGGAHAIIVA